MSIIQTMSSFKEPEPPFGRTPPTLLEALQATLPAKATSKTPFVIPGNRRRTRRTRTVRSEWRPSVIHFVLVLCSIFLAIALALFLLIPR